MVTTRSRRHGRSSLFNSLDPPGDDFSFTREDYVPEMDAEEEEDSDDFILPAQRRRRKLKKRKMVPSAEVTDLNETPTKKRQRILKARKACGPKRLTDQEQLIKKAYKLLSAQRHLVAKGAVKTIAMPTIETKVVQSTKVVMKGHVPGLGNVSMESHGPSHHKNGMPVRTASAVEGKDSKERALKLLAIARRKKEEKKACVIKKMDISRSPKPSSHTSTLVPKRPTRRKLQSSVALDDFVPVSSSKRVGVMVLLPGISVLDALNGMDEVEQLEKLYIKAEQKLKRAVGGRTFNPVSSTNHIAGKSKTISHIYISGLPLKMTERELEAAFYHCGVIRAIKLLPGNRGNGIITFQTHEMALNAIKDMNGRNIKGQPINVTWGRVNSNKTKGRRGFRGNNRNLQQKTQWVRGEKLLGNVQPAARSGLGFVEKPMKGEEASTAKKEESEEVEEIDQFDMSMDVSFGDPFENKDEHSRGGDKLSPNPLLHEENTLPQNVGDNQQRPPKSGTVNGSYGKNGWKEGRSLDQDVSLPFTRLDSNPGRLNSRVQLNGLKSRCKPSLGSDATSFAAIPKKKKISSEDSSAFGTIQSSDAVAPSNNCWIHPERRRAGFGDTLPVKAKLSDCKEDSKLPLSTDLDGLALVPKRGSDHEVPEAVSIDYGF